MAASSATAAAVEHLDLQYIPAEAAAAIVAHPQAVLTRPGAEMMPVEVITAAGLQAAGFDPVKIKEAVLLVAPPSHTPSPDFGAILRFSDAYSKADIIAKLKGAKSVASDGKTFFQAPGPGLPLLYFPDARTIIFATPTMMNSMLAAKNVESPLITLLKKVDVSADLTALVSIDALHDMLKVALAHLPPLPPQLENVRKLPDLLSAVLVRVNVGEQLSASVILHAHDDASAADVENLVNQGLALARQMFRAQLASAPQTHRDPVEAASMKYALRISDKVFAMFKPVRTGNNVTISAKAGSNVATIGVLISLLLPAVQAARAAARRVQSANNLKQIALALLEYESTNGHFPAHAIANKAGKPLLSCACRFSPIWTRSRSTTNSTWMNRGTASTTSRSSPASRRSTAIRRAPWMERPTIWFRSAKDWASKTKRKCEPPSSPMGRATQSWWSRRTTIGPFPGRSPPTWTSISRNRWMAWAAQPGGFNVAMFDGSVRFLQRIDAATLRALFTRAGAEPAVVP